MTLHERLHCCWNFVLILRCVNAVLHAAFTSSRCCSIVGIKIFCSHPPALGSFGTSGVSCRAPCWGMSPVFLTCLECLWLSPVSCWQSQNEGARVTEHSAYIDSLWRNIWVKFLYLSFGVLEYQAVNCLRDIQYRFQTSLYLVHVFRFAGEENFSFFGDLVRL